jgi:hypothetical protein
MFPTGPGDEGLAKSVAQAFQPARLRADGPGPQAGKPARLRADGPGTQAGKPAPHVCTPKVPHHLVAGPAPEMGILSDQGLRREYVNGHEQWGKETMR